jgi:hypothetical protein
MKEIIIQIIVLFISILTIGFFGLFALMFVFAAEGEEYNSLQAAKYTLFDFIILFIFVINLFLLVKF